MIVGAFPQKNLRPHALLNSRDFSFSRWVATGGIDRSEEKGFAWLRRAESMDAMGGPSYPPA
jgi:hypothetical protein